MSTASPTETAPTFQDRRTWLIILGNLLILFGVLSLFGALANVFNMLMAMAAGARAEEEGAAAYTRFAVLSHGMTAVVSVVFAGIYIWLGVGSILCRRWARKIIATGAWVMGALQFFGLLVMAYAVAEAVPLIRQYMEGFMVTMMAVGVIIGVAIMAFFYVAPCILYGWFYGTDNVRLTCEWRDPKPRWTDRVPSLVLVLAVLQVYIAVYLPVAMAAGFFPWGNTVLRGLPASALCGLYLLGSLYMVWALARMRRSGWLVAVAMFAAIQLPATYAAVTMDYGKVMVDYMDEYVVPGLTQSTPMTPKKPGAKYLIDDEGPMPQEKIREVVHALAPTLANVAVFAGVAYAMMYVLLLGMSAPALFRRKE